MELEWRYSVIGVFLSDHNALPKPPHSHPVCLPLPNSNWPWTMLSKTESVSRMAEQHEVSRKFLYQQKENATEALENQL